MSLASHSSRASKRLALLLAALPLAACNTIVMKPFGDIAQQQSQLIVTAVVLMLLIVVPVIVLTLVFAWRYRSANQAATYAPEWDHSTRLELLIWGAPLLIIIALGAVSCSTPTLFSTSPTSCAPWLTSSQLDIVWGTSTLFM